MNVQVLLAGAVRLSQDRLHVRFGSLADILRCGSDVRFTPNSGVCSALAHVRFVPIADIAPSFDHSVGARVALKWESAAMNRRRVVTAETRQ